MPLEKPWLRHYPQEIDPTYDYPRHNVAQFLIDAAREYPKRPALEFMGKRLSYEQLLEECCRFANALVRLGIGSKERVAIMLPNCPQTVIAYYGTLMAGCIAVLTNPLYKERELAIQLSDSGAAAIVTLDVLYPRVRAVQARTQLRHAIVTSIKDYLPFPKNVLFSLKMKKNVQAAGVKYDDHVHAFAPLLKSVPPKFICAEVDGENDLALLQYTGGTTSTPKGVMLTHRNLVANTMQSAAWFYKVKRGEEVFLGALPFFHVFGMTILMNLCTLCRGMNVLVPKFEASEMLQIIHKLRPTVFPGAPTMYISLINHPDTNRYDLSSIHTCISGASSLPLEVQEKFEALTGCVLIEGYGLTEASPITHANLLWGKRKNGSIGIPFPDTEAKIVDSYTGEELPQGEVGELIVRGPQVMKGYWNKPEETVTALRDGWLYTGDLGRQDEEGFFSIIDRKKDLIIAGGFNIYPREVEEVLYEHPSVKEAVVVGVPDAYRGETVKAYIVTRAGAQVTEDELNVWCRERMASFKVPRQYEFRSELPKTIAGKVLRRMLLEEDELVKK
ncbi:long-chain fatty acid--CoA ligase [Paenibacillus alvei]|uniref:Long-chain fatty acid--CoA ligase n=1 Tax=Paenibacillus alvei TaxID=44250 RepID=A0ABT4GVH7_PAEAL|nr:MULTISPECIES: long-chain fatty acid--CoA ligase [Paenibacillus]EJW19526.1 long-chain-fatty-acid--CoA ligase LcfA [Paenibacillus alvei DSM 29]MCY7485643.1 long-chain fatty acid--CoA ligase [Paenibacillus alvei]MCY9541350.1 long-chain fatty acid--CoA ligase [Paenibacillus alvei]MCY9702743.1 long-chain fatty acid--CoA ligase [Paenibacillus alvei]MCY9734193.1 long-chain fatty acid--CoA ligase [Paenibacillus alvei]